MARHTSIWLCSIFFSSRLSSICLSFSHSSNPINPINHHPIHINSTTAWLCFRLHLTRLSFTFLVSSLTRLSFKFLSTFFFSFKPSKPDSFLSIFLSFFFWVVVQTVVAANSKSHWHMQWHQSNHTAVVDHSVASSVRDHDSPFATILMFQCGIQPVVVLRGGKDNDVQFLEPNQTQSCLFVCVIKWPWARGRGRRLHKFSRTSFSIVIAYILSRSHQTNSNRWHAHAQGDKSVVTYHR